MIVLLSRHGEVYDDEVGLLTLVRRPGLAGWALIVLRTPEPGFPEYWAVPFGDPVYRPPFRVEPTAGEPKFRRMR